MTHIKVTIDDVVEFDGSVTDWQRKPPSVLRDQIKPDATPRPHMKAIMVAMTDAIMARQSVSIDASTDADGWALKVRYR